MKDSVEIGSSNRWEAFYKGLKITVYSVNKSEINLTRQDLIELVNVRTRDSHFKVYFEVIKPVFQHSFC